MSGDGTALSRHVAMVMAVSLRILTCMLRMDVFSPSCKAGALVCSGLTVGVSLWLAFAGGMLSSLYSCGVDRKYGMPLEQPPLPPPDREMEGEALRGIFPCGSCGDPSSSH